MFKTDTCHALIVIATFLHIVLLTALLHFFTVLTHCCSFCFVNELLILSMSWLILCIFQYVHMYVPLLLGLMACSIS